MTKSSLPLLAAFACVLFLSGCASKSYAVLVDSPDGSTGAITVTNAKGTTVINKKQQGMALDGSSAPFDVKQEQIERDFSSAIAAQPVLPKQFQIYFQTGGTSLVPESEILLNNVLETVRTRGVAAVSVIGHTDTVGDEAINEKLALGRAQSIAERLQAAGLKTIELTVTSHGERNLLIKTPDNTAMPQNRRVEVTIR